MLPKLFDQEKFEALLVANWTQFINSSKLLAFVLQKVQENTNCLAIISCTKIKNKGATITISNFAFKGLGFTIWVDFSVPLSSNRLAEGTIELFLNTKSEINYNTITGNIMES